MNPDHVKSCAEWAKDEAERVHRLYLPVYNMDVLPHTHELPDYYAAHAALEELVRRLLPQSSCNHFITPQGQAKCSQCQSDRKDLDQEQTARKALGL